MTFRLFLNFFVNILLKLILKISDPSILEISWNIYHDRKSNENHICMNLRQSICKVLFYKMKSMVFYSLWSQVVRLFSFPGTSSNYSPAQEDNNKMAKMPIYWHFWKSGYCTFPMKTNDTAEIRRTHRWIICMFKVLPTFRSGSNSTYTPTKSHSERPVTHGTHFFGIYMKNRADRCSRVVKDTCNTPSPEIPKYDNTPPYRKMQSFEWNHIAALFLIAWCVFFYFSVLLSWKY